MIWNRSLLAAALLAITLKCRAADEAIQPFQAETIKPFQAETLRPIQSDTNKPVPSGGSQPLTRQGGTSTNRGAGTIEVFQAETTRLMKPAGMDIAPVQGPLDKKLVGTWALFIPGVAYQSEQDRGSYTERTLHVGTGGSFGRLSIQANGEYRWTRNGQTSAGKLKQVIPHNFADPKLTYWRVGQGKETYYLAAETAGELTLYSPASNLFAARGKPQKQ